MIWIPCIFFSLEYVVELLIFILRRKKKSYIWSSKPKEYVHNRHRDGNNIATNKELKTARLDRGLKPLCPIEHHKCISFQISHKALLQTCIYPETLRNVCDQQLMWLGNAQQVKKMMYEPKWYSGIWCPAWIVMEHEYPKWIVLNWKRWV